MPPLVPRKRLRESPTPQNRERGGIDQVVVTPVAARRKATLFDDLDAALTPLPTNQLFTEQSDPDANDSESSLTSLSDRDFEEAPLSKRRKLRESDSEDDDDDDIEFEDVAALNATPTAAPIVSGDLELTLSKDTRVSLTNPFGDKKGPSKRERKVRNATHCVHVLLLLWHNALRNSWLCDPEIQAIMVSHLPPQLWDEVERWRRSSGLSTVPTHFEPKPKGPRKRRARSKVGGRCQSDPQTSQLGQDRTTRDWGSAADKLEEGAVDMSQGDPLFRLMQSLVPWWKQRYRVTAPGLRKWGYMALERLDRITKAYKIDFEDPVRFGERIASLKCFRQCAQDCRGSRDVGAQLFVVLLRGLGIQTRMVATLQSLGFGWNKFEDAEPEKEDVKTRSSESRSISEVRPSKSRVPNKSKATLSGPSEGPKKVTENGHYTRSVEHGKSQEQTHDVLKLDYEDTDDESVVERDFGLKEKRSSFQKLDTDLEYPHYWVEVLSPVTGKFLPVDPLVKGVIATNRDLVESFEPRGSKADKARQITAYIVGFSSDGTAKDVTVRYLKKQRLPGRTKGMRMPIEKVPIFNQKGKVKQYEQFDWFKRVMAGYTRGTKEVPATEIDWNEDSTDLKPTEPEKKEVKEGEETLQYYKQSKEFVLERHLKREEALRSGAKAFKTFKNRVKVSKEEVEEDVFLRSDVVNVKSAETWHKQGRAPIPGEVPLKRVPYRAATLNRRREILEAEAATGEKVLQGLFSFDQTDWIIPPPIQNGVIPKNHYGNIDLFAEHMCPEGAVHVPFRGAMRVCKRLQIDFAEAVVDFDFGHRIAVPVVRGVVIAEEFHDQVMRELEKDEAERERKEDEKRRKAALGQWRKFIMGLRIVERIRQDYGTIDDSVSVFGHNKIDLTDGAPMEEPADELQGGFLPEGFELAEDEDTSAPEISSFFPVGEEDGEAPIDDGLIVEDARIVSKDGGSQQKIRDRTGTAQKGRARAKRKPNMKTRPRTRSRAILRSPDDVDEEIEDEWINPDGSDSD